MDLVVLPEPDGDLRYQLGEVAQVELVFILEILQVGEGGDVLQTEGVGALGQAVVLVAELLQGCIVIRIDDLEEERQLFRYRDQVLDGVLSLHLTDVPAHDIAEQADSELSHGDAAGLHLRHIACQLQEGRRLQFFPVVGNHYLLVLVHQSDILHTTAS